MTKRVTRNEDEIITLPSCVGCMDGGIDCSVIDYEDIPELIKFLQEKLLNDTSEELE